jgi:enamine deaminase RidA (YjgF/YER057c/UK114 family)
MKAWYKTDEVVRAVMVANQNQEVAEERPKLLETAGDLYAKLVTAESAQRVQIEAWHRRAMLMRWLNVVLSLLTTAAIVIALMPHWPWSALAAVVLTFITSGTLLAQIGFDPSRHELEYRLAASRLAAERSRFLMAIGKVSTPTVSIEEAQREVETLARESALIQGLMREPGDRAHRRAKAALRRGDESALSRDEIDRLLPEALRARTSEVFHRQESPFTMPEHGAHQPAVQTQPIGPSEIKPQTDC